MMANCVWVARLHSALGYRPPAEYETELRTKTAFVPAATEVGFQGIGKSTAMIEETVHAAP